MIQFIRQIIADIFGVKQNDDHFSGYMIKNSMQLFMVHGFSLGIGFFSNFILVKVAGVNNYGSYVYIFNLLYLLAGFCIFGTDTLLVKKVSVYDAAGKYRELKGIIIFTIGIAIVGSIVIAIVSEVIIRFSGATKNLDHINWFVLALPVLLMLSVTLINQSSLQGLKKIFLNQLAEKIIRPVFFITSILIFFYIKKKVTLEELIWMNVTAIGIVLLITSILHQKNIGYKIKNLKPEYDLSSWGSSALAFFLISIFYILNSRVNIFFLGLLKGNDEVGVYNIILKISEAITLILAIINFVLAPLIAKLFSTGELAQLQKLITRSAQIVLLVSIPVMLAIIIFKRDILLFFGNSFLNGQQALVILCAGQLVSVLCGSVGLLLTMTGNQRFSIYSLVASTAFSIIFNIILIPRYGIIGTAIANAGSLVIWNCLMYFFVRKKINIRPTAFGVI